MRSRRDHPARGTRSSARINGSGADDKDVSVARERIESGAILDERYRLEGQIGRGAMGVVYRATDLKLERPVALKVLAEASSDERRLHAEVRALARLSHPNLLRIYDAGEEGDDVFFVMELIEGTTLAERIQQGRLDPGETARVGADVAAALAYVHQRGIVHRDVKPANILIDEEGAVRLADFGVARLVDSAGITATGTSIGTPAYLSPEQVRASGVGPESDVFALGLVLLECLTGRRAYSGTATEVAAARLHAPPEIPSDVAPGLGEFLGNMTALDPQRRPAAEEVASFLSARRAGAMPGPFDAVLETVSDTRKSSTVADTASRGVTSVVPFASQRQPWRVVRGRKVPIVIAASVLAAFGFGVGLGSTFVSGPSRAGAGAVLHHSKQKHPSRPDPTTTSTPSTSTTSTTTTVPQLTAGQAASRVDSAIERGVANGTIPAPLAQQLTNAVQPIIAPALSGDPQQTIQLFDELVQQFDQSVTNGQVSDPATVDQVDAALSRLAATLGVALPTGVEPGGPTPGGGDGGNGNGFGNGNGYGDTGGGNG